METPSYPPTANYVAPVLAPYELSVRTCSVAELMSIPDAWAVVIKYMPAVKMMISVPLVQPQLNNMTLVDFGVFTNQTNNPALLKIDEELKQLSASQRVVK